MKGRSLLLAVLFIILWIFTIYYSESFIFYLIIGQCTWPQLKSSTAFKSSTNHCVPAMILADTHVLSTFRTSWWNILRTDWQMYMAFQTALSIHKPETIFMLGDVTDDGLHMNNAEFEHYTQHFFKLFPKPKNVVMHIISGNHDIGFEYEVTVNMNGRFIKTFDAVDVRMLTIRGNRFVLINSMILENNGTCGICDKAKSDITTIGSQLQCLEHGTDCDVGQKKIPNYSRPILIQHFPMYRESDKNCHEPDEAPPHRKYVKFNESLDCHSKNTSEWLLKELNPRIVFSGHVHDGCTTQLPNQGVEFTIASFNWVHKDKPSYGLAVFTPDDYAFTRCLLPTEIFANMRYIFYIGVLFYVFFYLFYKRRKRRKFLFLIFKYS